ncbi:thioester reductase [Marinomonas sp. SBI22]|uniref:non-ribosomal peptide synthetase n=1 Tax=unclassified Marinomonas TaxID=196814 RepID=UPI0007AF26DC|nr:MULTISPECIES: non-ribosomal peptide synthetase [unclassified Marinomonas]KZM42639.1 thioester reductase [Marinomonas sp. SBI22]KZM44033.1 thioester reductase [Marinomonas sp. SBI8L]
MSYDNNQAGVALTYQQSLIVKGDESPKYRRFWLNLGDAVADEVESRLRILVEHQQALTTDFSIPEGFNVLRQQVQAARVNWSLVQNDDVNNGIINGDINKSASADKTVQLEVKAEQAFAAEKPHLLAWFVQTSEWEDSQNRLLLIGSELVLDEGTAARIREVLIGDREADIEPEMQYLDYANWINELQEDEDAADAVSFWKGFQWQDLPGIELNERLASFDRNLEKSVEGKTESKAASVRVPFSREMQDLLAQKAETMEVEPQTIGLITWAALLQRVSGREQFQLSHYHDCRDDYEELDDCFGLVQQRLPVPFYDISAMSLEKALMGFQPLLDEQAEYQEYVQQVSETIVNAYSVNFQFVTQASLGNLETSAYLPKGDALQLQLVATESGAGEWILTYDESKYSALSMVRLVERLPVMLEQALSAPNEPLGCLNALLESEQNALVSSYVHDVDNKAHDLTLGLVESIRQHASHNPDAPALREGDSLLSYADLDRQSDLVATNLVRVGVKTETVVALCLPRSAELVLAMLAVLKSGAAYLPIDPELAKARIESILNDAKAVVIVTSDVAQSNLDQAVKASADVLLKEGHESEVMAWSQLVTEIPYEETVALTDILSLTLANLKPSNLAYLLYTSGSTGKPKGVQVTHENILHYSQSAIRALELPKEGHYGLVSSLMADLGNTMLFPAWLQGGCVHLIGREESTDATALAKYYEQSPLDCLKIVPSHLSALLSGSDASVLLPKQVLVLGGERISDGLLSQLKTYQDDELMSCKLFNHYGPTETTVGVLWNEVDLDTGDAALGGVMGDTQVYLLDQSMTPVISGQVGELYIAGSNLSRGYLNASDLTSDRYLPNPFVAGGRFYQSGDLAMRRADGSIDILGRADQQVKIRGFRLELEEIESLLASHQTVQHSSVLLQGEEDQAHLVAFAVPYVGGVLDEESLKAWLAEQLPDYMVPTQLIGVKYLPLNANGKVDRHNLLEQARQKSLRTYVAPRNDIEQTLCELWQEILQQPSISVTDKFFDIGGHSLAAIKVVARMRQIFAQEFPTDLLFRKQSVEALAEFISEASSHEKTSESRLVEISRSEESDVSIVVMHSHGGHVNYYEPLFENLTGKANIYGVLSNPELLSSAEESDFENLMDDYVQQFKALKGEKIVLAGWSLAARHMMLLTHRLQAEGFDIKAVSIIDYDPLQTLDNQDDDLVQIKADLEHYLAIHNGHYDAKKLDLLVNDLTTKASATADYKHVLKEALDNPDVQQLLGEELPTDWVYQTVLQRWVLKKIFYAQAIPVVNVPLWVWCSDNNISGIDAWCAFTSDKVIGNNILSDHFSILFSNEMAQQLLILVDEIQLTKPVNDLEKESA